MNRLDVDGIVQAAGRGERLGLGPKAWVELGGMTLLERSVRVLLPHARRVVAAVPPEDVERAAALLAPLGAEAIAGHARRHETTRHLLAAADAPWLLLHDCVHPFVDAELCRAVLAAAAAGGAATAGHAVREFGVDRDGRVPVVPGDFSISTKPVGVRRELLERAYADLDAGRLPDAGHDRGVLELAVAAGGTVAVVPAPAWSIKLTTPDDLEVARVLIGESPPLALPDPGPRPGAAPPGA